VRGCAIRFHHGTHSDCRHASLDTETRIVLESIRAAGNMGVWIRTLRAKTNLHVQVVTRCIKTLETQKLIKNVKSVKACSFLLALSRGRH
jgi:carbamoylphosphate synthase small subunit